MLTGKIGVRFGLFGKLIVQVEHDRLAHPPGHSGMFWEDASINELLQAMRISGQFSLQCPPQHSSSQEKP